MNQEKIIDKKENKMGADDIVLVNRCPSCHKEYEVRIPKRYEEDLSKWWLWGCRMQATRLKELTEETRESLISGVCPSCQ